MKVLILGASGFIGYEVAQAFVRAGHIVYAQSRSKGNEQRFLQNEMTPVIADPSKPDEWVKTLDDVDVVVNTLGGVDHSLTTTAFRAVVEYVKAHRPATMGEASPKLTYIHSGGSWVYSEGPRKWVDERREGSHQVGLTAWRREQETEILTNKVINPIVIRPALLYGRSGSLLDFWFSLATDAAKKGEEWQIPGDDEARFSLIHTDDLADLYLRVAERSDLLSGMGIVGANGTEGVTDIMNKLNRIVGAKGWSYRKPNGAFEEALACTIQMKPTTAENLLGWRQRKMSLADGLEFYYKSWLASKEKKA